MRKSPQYEISDKEVSEDSKKLKKALIIGVIVLSLMVIVPVTLLLAFAYGGKTQVNINNTNIEIKAGLYGKNVDFKDIQQIYIKNSIPDMKKVVGIDSDSIKKGDFDISGYKGGSVFIESDKGPYLYIITNNNTVIIDFKDHYKTDKYFKEIKEKIIKQR